jgi:hypothetical protein
MYRIEIPILQINCAAKGAHGTARAKKIDNSIIFFCGLQAIQIPVTVI